MFSKKISEISSEDISQVIKDKVRESDQVEFKEALPTKDGSPHPSGGKIPEYTRNKLIEEIIAFANTYGGWLLIGIEETKTKPPIAQSIKPVQNCIDIAHRLELAFRDCIDPQIPGLRVEGVETSGKGEGVIVVYAPKSLLAPHRLSANKECYIRRADRTEKMSMREIQDLTINIFHSSQNIQEKFIKSKEDFKTWANYHSTPYICSYAFRLTAIPFQPLRFEQVYKENDLLPRFSNTFLIKAGDTKMNVVFPFDVNQWRANYRGAHSFYDDQNSCYHTKKEIGDDGRIEFWFLMGQTDPSRRGDYKLYPGWVLSPLISSICAIENFRVSSGSPETTFGLEFHLEVFKAPILLIGYQHNLLGGDIKIEPGEHLFDLMTLEKRETFSNIIGIFERDFINLAGGSWSLIDGNFEENFEIYNKSKNI